MRQLPTANSQLPSREGDDRGAPAPAPRAADDVVQVRVVHGNLAFTRYPVAVGHYSGDSIVSAEKHLDRALHGVLAERLHLGLYPGPIETNAIFGNPQRSRDPYARPGGAIIVGLGSVGSLSASLLTRSFSRALLEYVLERRKGTDPESGGIGLASLLIGTGAGGMSVADSVFALVRGLAQANKALAAANQAERITDVELIELYEDRAILALEALDRLRKRTARDAGFRLVDELGTRDGGLQRVSYEDEAPEWWHRLQVLGGGAEGEGASPGLRFAAVTRRARTEVRLLATQRTVVDQFVRSAQETTRHDAGVGRTLFDLLLPNELKESAPEQDNLVLLLDQEAARYPWEMLEDAGNRGGLPFAVDHGLLRQLEAHEFRTSVRGTSDLSALVIGDPVSSFAELTGAQAEAAAVAQKLQPAFDVRQCIRPSSQEVIAALFEQPFRVLHLAGHGVYRYAPAVPGRCGTCGQALAAEQEQAAAPATVTGMVIGDGVYLTPGEVAQMRSVPDLVFINCCYLGQMDAAGTAPTPQELAFPDLAANLATEFIRMGVRAVVAAGWAVEDAPATVFATTFYDQMVNGSPFGEAVKAARAATYEMNSRSNTWGAYQCYGDPDFRLVLNRTREAEVQQPSFLSPAHALRDLGNIAARLKTHSSERHADEVARLDRIVSVLEQRNWLRYGSITAALGRAFGEAGELQRAVDYYWAAMGAEDGAVTARDLEQYANLSARLALARWRAAQSDPEITRDAIARIHRSIFVLKCILGGHRGDRLTSERLALLGSAYKGLAWIDPMARAAALPKMAAFYRQAAAKARECGGDAAYPLLNARWAELAMRWQGVTDPSPPALISSDDLAEVRAEIDRKEQKDGPQFWLDSMRVDCELLEAIHTAVPADQRIGQIADRYLARLEHASAREFASTRDQLEFLAAMAAPHGEAARLFADLRQRLGADPSSAVRV
jgi:CHAT domain